MNTVPIAMNHITIIVALAFGFSLAAALSGITVVYAQYVPLSSSPPPPTLPHSSPPLHLQGPPAKLHAIKIASPARGQQVPIGKNLTVSGSTSTLGAPTGNTATSSCQVFVIANGVKPYQSAKGTGPGGAADYSTWSYVLTSKHTTIKPGPDNKITAKYICSNNQKQASFYSVNVTGTANNLHTTQIAAPHTGATSSPQTSIVSVPHTRSPSPTTTTVVKQKEQHPVITGNSNRASSIGLNTPSTPKSPASVTYKQKPKVATSNIKAAGLNNNNSSSAIVAGISIPSTPGTTTTTAVTYEQKPKVATSNSSTTSSLLGRNLLNNGSSELSGQSNNLATTDHRNHGYNSASSSSSESTHLSDQDTSSHKAPRIHISSVSHQDYGKGNPRGTLYENINQLKNSIMDNVKKDLENNGIRVPLP
ncbi:MAG: hypothetical protein JO327_11915 [Nitrososphaeraceae archaeon]|nr:hypothetical protein [Nitrososphaeraceae archaeon]